MLEAMQERMVLQLAFMFLHARCKPGAHFKNATKRHFADPFILSVKKWHELH